MTKSRSTGKRNKGSKSYSKAVLKAAIEVKNCRKRSASDSDSSESKDDDSSDGAPPKRRHRKKVKPVTEVDEEVENELEEVAIEVVESEEPGEEPDEERRGTAQTNKVSTM
jgi:hypothetical protein